MKNTSILSIVLALTLYAVPGPAVGAGCSSTVCTASIARLVLWQGGDISIEQELSDAERADMESAGTCLFPSGRYIVLRRSHVSFQEIYALLLTTKSAGAEISLRVKSTPGASCEVSYAVTK